MRTPGLPLTVMHAGLRGYTYCGMSSAVKLRCARLALGAHHDAVLGVLQRGHGHVGRPVARRPQRRQVHQVRQVRAAEARRPARYHLRAESRLQQLN